MADTPTRDAKLVQFLNEGVQRRRSSSRSRSRPTPASPRTTATRSELKDHLKETKSHATQLSRRIKQLGGTPATVSLQPDGVGRFAQNVVEKVEQAKAAAHGLDAHRAHGRASRRRCCATRPPSSPTRRREIATYTVIDSLATRPVGDKTTAKLARDIRRDEERMQKFLADLLPELSEKVAHDEIPISEIE